jgi:hypothetical protein
MKLAQKILSNYKVEEVNEKKDIVLPANRMKDIIAVMNNTFNAIKSGKGMDSQLKELEMEIFRLKKLL